MEVKKEKNILLKFLLIIFIIFLILYFSKGSSYYEFKMFNRSRLTQEAVTKFENDTKEGKDLTLEDYVVDSHIDYSNPVSDAGYYMGSMVEKIMNEGIKKTLKVLSDLFYN